MAKVVKKSTAVILMLLIVGMSLTESRPEDTTTGWYSMFSRMDGYTNDPDISCLLYTSDAADE